jgi:hypothetical protein
MYANILVANNRDGIEHAFDPHFGSSQRRIVIRANVYLTGTILNRVDFGCNKGDLKDVHHLPADANLLLRVFLRIRENLSNFCETKAGALAPDQ